MKNSYWLLAIGCWLPPATSAAAPDSLAAGAGPRVATGAPENAWWVGVWTGAAKNSPFGTRHGERHRDYYMTGLRVGRTVHASPQLAFDYFVDLVPWIRSTGNPVKYSQVATCTRVLPSQALVCTSSEVMETATAHGYAVTPIGLQMRAWQGRPVELVVGASFGAVMYDQRVPDPGEKRLNFMGDITLGVHVRTDPRGAVIAGVRQNHTSNASTGEVNPGLDSRVLYFGVTRFVSRRAQP
ncbi:MAG TPA: acyloxyacyl hydrolase [Gemmatimonadaceae bacterium]|nr:acyloxyacyl hydrolase [Gemmatimonadaceae bacterium]